MHYVDLEIGRITNVDMFFFYIFRNTWKLIVKVQKNFFFFWKEKTSD